MISACICNSFRGLYEFYALLMILPLMFRLIRLNLYQSKPDRVGKHNSESSHEDLRVFGAKYLGSSSFHLLKSLISVSTVRQRAVYRCS